MINVSYMRYPVTMLLACFICQARSGVVTVLHPEDEFDFGDTVVWSPLFQATWDVVNAELGGKPQKVDPPNGLMGKLDGFEWDAEKVMPEKDWKVWGGRATNAFLKRVNRETAEMTGEKGDVFTLVAGNPDVIACFGLLNREVEFENEFFESKKKPLAFRTGDKVENMAFFGSAGKLSGEYGDSVKVLGHSNNWHALEVSCKKADDKVVFYLPPEALAFVDACEVVRKLRKGFVSGGLHEGDLLCVPYVALDVKEDLAGRLSSGRWYGKAGDPWRIGRAEQVTRFELHEKGARVRVETSVDMIPFGPAPRPPQPRNFIYDRPFFVFLWRDGAEWPYFGVWVGDTSALREFQSGP